MASLALQNRATAEHLIKAGFYVFPCHSGDTATGRSKSPMPFLKWKEAASNDANTITAWWNKWPDAAVGLHLGKSGLIVIDADRKGEIDGVEAIGEIMAQHNYDPRDVPLVATPGHGSHFFYRQRDGEARGNGTGALPPGIDVRGAGGYVIAPGTIMADGGEYEVFGDIANAPVLPDWLADILDQSSKPTDAPRPPSSHEFKKDASLDELWDMLSAIPADCDYNEWIICLQAIHFETDGSSSGLEMVDQWSSGGSKYRGTKEIEVKWRSFRGSGITRGSLAEIARQHGADLSAIARDHMEFDDLTPEQDAEMKMIASNMLRAHLDKIGGNRVAVESDDGTLIDNETGEIIEPESVAPPISAKKMGDMPPGLVGEIASWIIASARRPQVELAIGAAMTLVGLASGRHIMGPTKAGTALFVLGLAPTASGKDHPLKQISRILNACHLGHHAGPSEFISMTSMINTIKSKPLCLVPMDEFGDFMRRVYARNGSSQERAITKIMRTVWSANFDPFSTPAWAAVESISLTAPHMSIYGVSTQEQFYTALQSGSTADGTLNRFLIIDKKGRPKEVKPMMDSHKVPQSIISGMQQVFKRSGELPSAMRNDLNSDPAKTGAITFLDWCADGAEQAWMDYAASIETRMDAAPHDADFLARAAEMAIRIATIVAAGCNADSVRIEHVRFGIKWADQSIDGMVSGAREHMAENEHEANVNKVMRLIKENGGMMKYRDIQRKMQFVRSRDLKEILSSLVESEQLEIIEIKTDRRNTYSYRLIVDL